MAHESSAAVKQYTPDPTSGPTDLPASSAGGEIRVCQCEYFEQILTSLFLDAEWLIIEVVSPSRVTVKILRR
jgi:hypothetical protein